MNVELFSYSIMASILGVAIVFLSLVGLCLLMVLLKVLFQEKEKPAASPGAAAPAAPAVSAKPRENTDWVMAAVAAFLMEEEGPAPSAAAWAPKGTEASDPWMNRAAFAKKLG